MRASAIAAVSLVSAAVGALAALAVTAALDWREEPAETVVVAPAAPPRGDPAPAAARSVAKPLVGDGFNPARLFAARSSGVVTIYAVFGEQAHDASAQGSGFVVSPKGYVLTNSHVVTTAGEAPPGSEIRPARTVYVQFSDGDRVPAEVVGWDPFTDVAVVKVDPRAHRLAPVPLGDSSRVVVGEPVAAIGSPFNNQNSLVVGVVSATHRSIASLTSDYSVIDAIQTDAAINRGNSGGPLFDARGRVIGVNAQIRSESGVNEGVGFAIPINAAKRSLEELVRHGRVSYAYVGIRTADVTPSIARRLRLPASRGALITEVTGPPASRAGLRGGTRTVEVHGVSYQVGGDLIVAIDGVRVRTADDVLRHVTDRLKPGDVAVFTVLRERERRAIAVRLGEREVRDD